MSRDRCFEGSTTATQSKAFSAGLWVAAEKFCLSISDVITFYSDSLGQRPQEAMKSQTVSLQAKEKHKGTFPEEPGLFPQEKYEKI